MNTSAQFPLVGSPTAPGPMIAEGHGLRSSPVPNTTSATVSFWGYQNLTAALWASGIATFTTALNHNFVVDALALVRGVNPTGYNCVGRIMAIPASNKFSISIAIDPGAYISGGFSCIEPELQLTSIAPNVPVMTFCAHDQSVPLRLDSDLPIVAFTGAGNNYHNTSWFIAADGHSQYCYAGGNLKSFINGYVSSYTADCAFSWTSGSASRPDTGTNRDTGFARNAPGVMEINNGTPGNIADVKVRNIFSNLPTADPHLVGQLWNNAGIVNISAG